jgi:cyclophilin family peptidyl-prolyl cis-trans isomerase
LPYSSTIQDNKMTKVIIKTNLGTMTAELDAEKAPKTVANFLSYMEAGHYNNTIFHRVIDGFMIQGGGFEPGMKQKPADTTVENEAKNGLKNDTYTLAMARTSAPHSASAQFFINVKTTPSWTTQARTAGATPCSAKWSKAPTWWTPSRKSKPPAPACSLTCQWKTWSSKASNWLLDLAAVCALFISDLHLQPAHPATSKAFFDFLAQHARHAQQLYLLGDLFEYWAGDDDITDPYHAEIVAALRAVSDAGVAVYWIAGNRDFLVGARFAEAANVILLPETWVAEIAGHAWWCCTATPSAPKTPNTWNSAPWCGSLRGRRNSPPCRWRSARPSSPACAPTAARSKAANPTTSWT